MVCPYTYACLFYSVQRVKTTCRALVNRSADGKSYICTFLWCREAYLHHISLPHFFGIERPYLHHISLPHFFGIERHRFALHFFATFLWYGEAIFASHFFTTFLWYREAKICITFLCHIFLGMEGPYLHHISLVYREAKKCDANISKKNLLLTAWHPQGG